MPYLDLNPFLNGVAEFVIDKYPGFIATIKGVTGVLVGVSIPISLFFLIVIIYCVEQLKRIRNAEEKIFDTKVVPAFEENVKSPDTDLSDRWESVVKHISTQNPNDWRQAIIDADIILDNILTKMGYIGQTVGEKLQKVAKGDFESLESAWEAHKVRNQIAHEGSNFALNEHEAKKAFDNYKKVFEEFYYV